MPEQKELFGRLLSDGELFCEVKQVFRISTTKASRYGLEYSAYAQSYLNAISSVQFTKLT